VATPSDFGTRGEPPSHPELLDWLALEFAERGWSMKDLHRQILHSTAYRQASRVPNTFEASLDKGLPETQIDPDNLLLWRMPLRRLESEIVRDSLLCVSGSLDRQLGGAPVPIKSNSDGSVEVDLAKATPSGPNRRSMYLLNRRNYHPTELGVFDQPTVALNCTRRISTEVVLQPLSLLNGPLATAHGERFAARVKQLAGADVGLQVDWAFRLALCRPPTAGESSASQEFLARQMARYVQQRKLATEPASEAALTNLCRMLLNTNEFLYIP
jgi:hypothetical protein